jgi:hypothetical protein
MNVEKWNELKSQGSSHYKSFKVEPIDYYVSLGIFEHFAIGNIIKYASRYAILHKAEDLDKATHYAALLKAYME